MVTIDRLNTCLESFEHDFVQSTNTSFSHLAGGWDPCWHRWWDDPAGTGQGAAMLKTEPLSPNRSEETYASL